MKEETPQELLDRMAPLFGLEKKRVGKNSFRWAEKSASTKRRPTQRAADVRPLCACIPPLAELNDMGRCSFCDCARR